MKITGAGCAAVVGFVAGINLDGLLGASCVVVSLFVGVVVAGLAIARLASLIDARRVVVASRMLKGMKPTAKARVRCRTCGRKRASFDGVLVCETCDAIAATSADIPERTRPE